MSAWLKENGPILPIVVALFIFAVWGREPLTSGNFQQAFVPCLIALALPSLYAYFRVVFQNR